jgi:hypothetical protein
MRLETRMLPPACVLKGTTRRLHPGGQDEEEEEVEGRRGCSLQLACAKEQHVVFIREVRTKKKKK